MNYLDIYFNYAYKSTEAIVKSFNDTISFLIIFAQLLHGWIFEKVGCRWGPDPHGKPKMSLDPPKKNYESAHAVSCVKNISFY